MALIHFTIFLQIICHFLIFEDESEPLKCALAFLKKLLFDNLQIINDTSAILQEISRFENYAQLLLLLIAIEGD